MNSRMIRAAGLVAALAVSGCDPEIDPGRPDGGSNTDGGSTELMVPETYEFKTRGADTSSVVYTGQTLRHVLIEDLQDSIVELTERIDAQNYTPVAGEVLEELEFYYRFNGAIDGDVAPKLSTTPPLLQTKYSDISSGANLTGKIAGKDDAEKQHKDWSTQFRGWAGATSPEALVLSWFQRIDELAVARANGQIPTDPTGAPISQVYLTPEGIDYHELIPKFLGGAIAFSQAADDYLDEGLSDDHTKLVEGKPYTALEHAWDEGFGYFGASVDYLKRTDDEVAAAAAHDSNNDGKIDLKTEYSYSPATYAAKRDRGSAATAKTDFSGEIMNAFLRGRAILAAADDALTAEQKADLEAQRNLLVASWEKAIAASTIHYLNEVLQDMGTFGTANYKFADHAKHWSEMKGFALSLQFNPRSPLTGQQFELLHQKIGDRPALPGDANVDAYKTALLEARNVLKEAYGFADANVGDQSGANGW